MHDRSCEILQILDGNGNFMIKGKLFKIKKNAIFLIPASEVHSSIPTDDLYMRNAVNISEGFIKSIGNMTDNVKKLDDLFNRSCVIVDGYSQNLISNEFERIKNAVNKQNQKDEITVLSSILNILCTLMRNTEKIPHLTDNKIAKALNYIDDNITKPISLDELSSYVYLSKYYFCKLFLKSTQMTPLNYILARRLSIAKNLIINTDLTISEIALASGFNSFSNFAIFSSICFIFAKYSYFSSNEVAFDILFFTIIFALAIC